MTVSGTVSRMSPHTTAQRIGSLCGGEPVSITRAQAAGITRAEIRAAISAGTLERVRHGVVTAVDITPADSREHAIERMRALMCRVDSDLLISHSSAALLHRLPLPPGVDDTSIHVTSLRQRRFRLPGVVVHAARGDVAAQITEVEGIPSTSYLRTGIDLARGLTLRAALIPLDASVRRAVIEDPCHQKSLHDDQRAESAIVTDRVLHSVQQQVARLRYCTGIDGLRFAASVTSPLSESPLESASRGDLIDVGLAPLTLQYRYTDADGRDRRADMLLAEGLIGEADGMVKYDGEAGTRRLKEEKLRDLATAEVGIRTLRWSATDVWSRRNSWIRHVRREIYAARRLHRNPLTKWSP
jgi:hypothetical protein